MMLTKSIIKQIFCIFIYILLTGCEAELIVGPQPNSWVPGYYWQSGHYYEALNQYDEMQSNNQTDPLCGDEVYLNMEAPTLDLDANGFYHMVVSSGYGSSQTFATLNAETGLSTMLLGWGSDTQYLYDWGGGVDTVDVVNPVSYTNSDGIAHTVFSAWDIFVGDTITVYSGYRDDCYIEHFDSLKIILED